MNNNVNRMYREYADSVAAEVARQLRLAAIPVCSRVTRRRGHASYTTKEFSVPSWAFQAHPAFRDYYIAHECCHKNPEAKRHGPAFHRVEQLLAERRGHRLHFNGNSPYPVMISELETGHPICDKVGRAL
jgi:predicted metal-dependent hydrolase